MTAGPVDLERRIKPIPVQQQCHGLAVEFVHPAHSRRYDGPFSGNPIVITYDEQHIGAHGCLGVEANGSAHNKELAELKRRQGNRFHG